MEEGREEEQRREGEWWSSLTSDSRHPHLFMGARHHSCKFGFVCGHPLFFMDTCLCSWRLSSLIILCLRPWPLGNSGLKSMFPSLSLYWNYFFFQLEPVSGSHNISLRSRYWIPPYCTKSCCFCSCTGGLPLKSFPYIWPSKCLSRHLMQLLMISSKPFWRKERKMSSVSYHVLHLQTTRNQRVKSRDLQICIM